MNSTTSPKVKKVKGERIRVSSLACSISGVKGHARAPRWGLRRLTSNSITHMDLHKLNSTLVNA